MDGAGAALAPDIRPAWAESDRLDERTPVTELQDRAATATLASTPEAAPPNRAALALLLGAFVAVGPLTIDMYLPALPTITAELGTTSAMVRDLFTGRAAATMLSRLFLVLGAAPVLAPTLGGELLRVTSWRGIFAVLAGYGLLLLAVGAGALRETLPPSRRSGRGVAGTLRTYRGLLRDRTFVGLVLVAGLTMAGLFSYVSGSSFVFQRQFGLDEQQFGLLFGAGAVWLIAATQLNPVVLRRWSPAQVLVTGVAVGAVAGAVLLVLAVTGTGGLPGVVVPLWAMLFASGLALPNAPALALSRHGESAGSAAALLGAVQFGVGAAVSPVVGLLGNDAAAMGTVILAALVLAIGVLVTVVRPWQLTDAPEEPALAAAH